LHYPENVKVYVVVPELQVQKKKPVSILTPHLAHRKQVADFKMKIDKA